MTDTERAYEALGAARSEIAALVFILRQLLQKNNDIDDGSVSLAPSVVNEIRSALKGNHD